MCRHDMVTLSVLLGICEGIHRIIERCVILSFDVFFVYILDKVPVMKGAQTLM